MSIRSAHASTALLLSRALPSVDVRKEKCGENRSSCPGSSASQHSVHSPSHLSYSTVIAMTSSSLLLPALLALLFLMRVVRPTDPAFDLEQRFETTGMAAASSSPPPKKKQQEQKQNKEKLNKTKQKQTANKQN